MADGRDLPDIKRTPDGRIAYEPDGEQLCAFITSNNFVDVIQGPLGSGKTIGLCLRIGRHSFEQAPSRLDGLRKTRWAFVRNSYPDLKRTTIRTWLSVFEESIYGRFNWGQPPSHKIAFADVRMEVDFLALDKPEDIRKLRSGEYTGIAFNELPFIEKELFDEAQSRVDRYPKYAEGGPTWTGVIADANAPDEDHWLGMMTGQVDLPPGLSPDQIAEYRWPDAWGFFMQPSALLEEKDQHGRITGYKVNPKAENLRWLSPTYYERQVAGKSKAWIDSRLMNRIALVVDGSPVYPTFRADYHVAQTALKPVEGHEVLLWLDFGRQPAALFAQSFNNRVYVQYELQGINEGAVTFAPKVKRFLEQHYGHLSRDGNLPRLRTHGDPKGRDRGQADERTAYDVFAANGMPVTPAPVRSAKDWITQCVEAVTFLLNDNPAGEPRLVISPYCRSLKVGMAGRYFLEREETGELKPTKNRYSHLCNALEFGVLSLGEGRRMIGLDPARPGRVIPPARRGSRRRVA